MAQYVEVNGQTIEFPDGMAAGDIEKAIRANIMSIKPAKSAVVQAGESINSIPRQLGLTARYGLEGLANAAQVFTEPMRYITDKLAPDPQLTTKDLILNRQPEPKSYPLGMMVSRGLDALGLPKPETATERVVGDATRLMAGAGGMGSAASAASALPGALGRAGAFLAANPAQQISSAAGAGLAGGASREAGGGDLMQAGASLLGGVAGGLAPGAVSGLVNTGRGLLNRNADPKQLDAQIRLILERSGADYSDLSGRAMQTLRAELGDSLRMGKDLDPAAVRRLADFARTGTTPTRGMVSQNPVQITREQNLAKMAANSSDEGLYGLPLIQNRNNAKLISNLNDAGATRGDAFRAGQSAIDRITATDAARQAEVSGLYSRARAMPGGETQLDRKTVIDNVYGALARENKLAFLPENVSSMLDQISAGSIKRGGQQFDVPFDAKALDNLLTTIATAQRGTQDGNVKAALSIARQAIDASPITPLKPTMGGNQLVTPDVAQRMRTSDAAAGEFMGALNEARSAARQRFGWQESSRPVEAALGGAAPDAFIKRFVIGGTLDDAQAFAQNAGTSEAKNAILAHLKDKALNGSADEVGKFSQSAYNKALGSIGDRKLAVFFSPEEISELKALGRVASYMQAQPVGSAVNNSNSGALMLGRGYDVARAIASKIPFGQAAIVDPLRQIDISLSQRAAQNLKPGLLAQTEKVPVSQGLLLPALTYGGGLLATP